MNFVGLPAVPRGNSRIYQISLENHGEDLTGVQFTFIANKDLSGRIRPPVFITWTYQAYQDVPDSDDPSPPPHLIYLMVPSSVTACLEPGAYYFNINMLDLQGNVTTILAGTWPILPVPGLMAGLWFNPGNQWVSPGWSPQLMNQFPPKLPRRSYAY